MHSIDEAERVHYLVRDGSDRVSSVSGALNVTTTSFEPLIFRYRSETRTGTEGIRGGISDLINADLPDLSDTYSSFGCVPLVTTVAAARTVLSATCSSVRPGISRIPTEQLLRVAASNASNLNSPCSTASLAALRNSANLGSLPNTLSAPCSKSSLVRSINSQSSGNRSAMPDVETSVHPATRKRIRSAGHPPSRRVHDYTR